MSETLEPTLPSTAAEETLDHIEDLPPTFGPETQDNDTYAPGHIVVAAGSEALLGFRGATADKGIGQFSEW